MKKYLFILAIIILSCNTKHGNSVDILTITKIEDGKNLINIRISKVKKMYDDLCDGTRNDQVKMKFARLQIELREINEIGSTFESLSYKDQQLLLSYTSDQIRKQPSLNILMNNATIECW